jgi:glycine/D-amino acid oxidase-like deaminating enzyme
MIRQVADFSEVRCNITMIYKLIRPILFTHRRMASRTTLSCLQQPRRPACTSAAQPPPKPVRVAVVGGGFAGVAASWHLLSRASKSHPVQLELFDAFGLGAGGSGAAAGLLHPFTAKGKLLWMGAEAFEEALRLVEAAEAYCDEAEGKLVWRHGVLRPARTARQAANFAKNVPNVPGVTTVGGAHCVTADKLPAIVPGLNPASLLPENIHDDTAATSGFFVPGAVVLHPLRYLAALWAACGALAAAASPASSAELLLHPVPSLAALELERGPYDAVIVAAGAAIGAIKETKDLLDLELCRGISLEMISSQSQAPRTAHSSKAAAVAHAEVAQEGVGRYPPFASSLLGSTYIAAHGSDNLVVGATKEYGIAPEEAYECCSMAQRIATGGGADAEAERALLRAAQALWPPLARGWRVAAARTGVRALPSRTPQGSIPYVGRVPQLCPVAAVEAMEGIVARTHEGEDRDVLLSSEEREHVRNWWVIGGLGARGLVYHAWLGRLTVEAALGGGEACLPQELLRWRAGGGGGGGSGCDAG